MEGIISDLSRPASRSITVLSRPTSSSNGDLSGPPTRSNRDLSRHASRSDDEISNHSYTICKGKSTLSELFEKEIDAQQSVPRLSGDDLSPPSDSQSPHRSDYSNDFDEPDYSNPQTPAAVKDTQQYFSPPPYHPPLRPTTASVMEDYGDDFEDEFHSDCEPEDGADSEPVKPLEPSGVIDKNSHAPSPPGQSQRNSLDNLSQNRPTVAEGKSRQRNASSTHTHKSSKARSNGNLSRVHQPRMYYRNQLPVHYFIIYFIKLYVLDDYYYPRSCLLRCYSRGLFIWGMTKRKFNSK